MRVAMLAVEVNDDGVLVTDEHGVPAYESQPLVELLSEEGDRQLLEQSIEDARRASLTRNHSPVELVSTPAGVMSLSGQRLVASLTLQVRTSKMEYRLRAVSLLDAGAGMRTPTSIVWVRRCRPHLLTAEILRDRYGLTPREVRVSRLLAARLRSREMAEVLGISIHTARRHAEAVLRKVGVPSRAELRDRLCVNTL
jgi:DNA-binding CsgD family transcriptional regulator